MKDLCIYILKKVDIFSFILMFFIVGYGWQGLELLIEGKIIPNTVDNIIGLVLVVSLTINCIFFKEFMKVYKKYNKR